MLNLIIGLLFIRSYFLNLSKIEVGTIDTNKKELMYIKMQIKLGIN